MSVFNGERYLAQSIERILGQPHSAIEFIIIDDGSTDSTDDIVRSYSDIRIKYFQNSKNVGLARSLNIGIQKSTAEIVARQDADDVSAPNRLKIQLEMLRRRPDVAAAGTNWTLIDIKGDTIGTFRVPIYEQETVKVQDEEYIKPPHGSWVFRRDVILDVGCYDERFRLTQDLDLSFRMIKAGHRIGLVPEVLYKYRMLPGQLEKKLETQRQFTELAYRRYRSETDDITVPFSLSDPTGKTTDISKESDPTDRYWYQLALLSAKHGTARSTLKYSLKSLYRPLAITSVKLLVKVPVLLFLTRVREILSKRKNPPGQTRVD